MSARDDFGSDAGRPGGRGGSNGGLANGGVGGGRGGGGGGGGAGRNGGYGSNTGLQTGNTWYGNTAHGRPGGRAGAYGMRDKYGNISNLKDWYGNPINPNPSVQQSPLNRPAVPGALSPVQPVPTAWPMNPAPYPGDMWHPAPYPGIGFSYNAAVPPGYHPTMLWAGGGLWGINRPPSYSGGAYQQNINNTGADGYPNPNQPGPYADDW